MIKLLWERILEAFPEIYGFRLGWTEIAFFHPSVDISAFQEKIVAILMSTIHPKLKSKAIFSCLTGTVDERLAEIDKMGLQLHKVNYWLKHIYQSYWENGKEFKLNNTQPAH